VGTAERQICAEEGRSANEESHCSEANESCDEEKAVGSHEKTVGFRQEGWRYVFIEPWVLKQNHFGFCSQSSALAHFGFRLAGNRRNTGRFGRQLVGDLSPKPLSAVGRKRIGAERGNGGLAVADIKR
jgi:hypothetical protein